MPLPRFDDLRENPPDEILPPLDRANPGDDVVLTPDALHWRERGYLVLPSFLPRAMVDASTSRRCLTSVAIRRS